MRTDGLDLELIDLIRIAKSDENKFLDVLRRWVRRERSRARDEEARRNTDHG